jgi:hypothetical protein
MVSPGAFPRDTLVWLAHWSGDRGLGAWGRGYGDNGSLAYCTTMLVAQLLVQVLTLRLPADVPLTDGELVLRTATTDYVRSVVRIRDLLIPVAWPPPVPVGPSAESLGNFANRLAPDGVFAYSWVHT